LHRYNIELKRQRRFIQLVKAKYEKLQVLKKQLVPSNSVFHSLRRDIESIRQRKTRKKIRRIVIGTQRNKWHLLHFVGLSAAKHFASLGALPIDSVSHSPGGEGGGQDGGYIAEFIARAPLRFHNAIFPLMVSQRASR